MAENGFTQVITSGCLYTNTDVGTSDVRRSQRRSYQLHEDSSVCDEPKEFPQYETSSASDVRRMLPDRVGASTRFETSMDRDWESDRYNTAQTYKYEPYDGYTHSRNMSRPVVRLKVAHQEPISIRPRNKNPQIVNVCQTFRFPDNFITQNNATRMVQQQQQQQERLIHQQFPIPAARQPPLLSPYRSTSRSRVGGFFSVYRRHRNMHSQTSRTMIELVEAEQKIQQQQQQTNRPTAGPRTTTNYGASSYRMAEESLLASSGSESSIGEPADVRTRMAQVDRKAKLLSMTRDQLRAGNGRTSQVPYFDRTKRNHSCTKLVDGGATMGGHYGRSTNLPAAGTIGKPSRYAGKPKSDNRRTMLGADGHEFVDDPFVSNPTRNRKLHLAEDSIDDEDGMEEEEDESDVGSLDEQLEHERDDCNGPIDLQCEGGDDHGEETIGDTFGRRHGHGAEVVCVTAGTKEGPVSISGIVDKLQDNVWEVCLEGIWDLMDTASRIDWKAQEKYITVINRKLIEFLKSPRTALCRSACQVSGELFRQAKSTKRPEFDEMVDILLCKTADPNRFIQKDANVALDKLVTYIPTPHTVRAISNRGTIHRNPLVRTATARLLVCICVVSGLDAILGTTANTRTRKTILSMLAKFLTDKNLETRKFGERLYRMLRKHKFFDEYFYKDMDNNLRTNLKRVLKGV
uniref:CLASP N-terminal domain-containing protein n=1 Tax=Anopheles culicifacies TaxID=139723 RepID=A0A182MH30_9DIPT